MLNLIYHEKGSHKGQINWAQTCPNIEIVQDLINEENLSSMDMFKKYSGLYERCYRMHWLKTLKFNRGFNEWGSYDSVEKVQEFVYENNLDIDGLYHYPGLYSKCRTNGWLPLLEISRKQADWSYYDTVEKVQELIDKENLCFTELKERYPGISYRITKNGWITELNFIISDKPYMESYFDELFPLDLYPIIKRDSTELKWLLSKEGGVMRPDVIIDTEIVKLVIEFQGIQHFIYTGGWNTEKEYSEAIERDELKYKLLTEHGYDVIYFVDTKQYPFIPKHAKEKFEPGGYIGGTTIMTSWDELVDLINEKLKEIEENATNL